MYVSEGFPGQQVCLQQWVGVCAKAQGAFWIRVQGACTDVGLEREEQVEAIGKVWIMEALRANPSS